MCACTSTAAKVTQLEEKVAEFENMGKEQGGEMEKVGEIEEGRALSLSLSFSLSLSVSPHEVVSEDVILFFHYP